MISINDGPCNSYIQVCCNKEDQVLQPPPPTLNSTRGCGYRRPNGAGFQITGDEKNESQFGEFPWMTAILGNDSYQCGGALIHTNAVITAAHCVTHREKKFKVRVGEWDTQHTSEPYPYQESVVKSITIHPNYYAGALYNDIAFLLLEEPVKISENVDLACLPPQNYTSNKGRCYATGWGKKVFDKEKTHQAILKKIDLPLVPRRTCQDKLRTTRLGNLFTLHESFLCAGGELGKDTCLGDGGSPLVCPIEGQEDRYYQAGVVAWGIGCGDEDVPGVYADVAFLRDWIDDQMKFNNLDTAGYNFL
ncbi:hypothetical protein NQ317_006301 [Molorchus minor]|uniref:Peptidase S1 domain-containing protein n=1 Tax=Molorchus minor TaxID=1323400 RepID=A0ABQ9JJN0_9CUCU|nr:hypothetical protein NQ317_006301 [Molorchus minor]